MSSSDNVIPFPESPRRRLIAAAEICSGLRPIIDDSVRDPATRRPYEKILSEALKPMAYLPAVGEAETRRALSENVSADAFTVREWRWLAAKPNLSWLSHKWEAAIWMNLGDSAQSAQRQAARYLLAKLARLLRLDDERGVPLP